MQELTVDVKARILVDPSDPEGAKESRVVGQAPYYKFDNTAEADATLGAATVLNLINTQHRTNEMNKVRAAATSGPSKADLDQAVLTYLSEHSDELQACAGDGAKVANLMAEIRSRIEQEQAQTRAALLAAAPTASEDEDENE